MVDIEQIAAKAHRQIQEYRPDVGVEYIAQVIRDWETSGWYPQGELDADIINNAEPLWVQAENGPDVRALAQRVHTCLVISQNHLSLRGIAGIIQAFDDLPAADRTQDGQSAAMAAQDVIAVTRVIQDTIARRWYRARADMEISLPGGIQQDGIAESIMASPLMAQIITRQAMLLNLPVVCMPASDEVGRMVLIFTTAGQDEALAKIASRFAPEAE